ncbi:MAG: hypothetical protein Q4G09_02960 [Clostridia bacterium]|nr:hypothetical protein [Clostridia bacterium]
MSKSTCKASYTRFVYSIIEFLSQECQYQFDISSYVKNDENLECNFSNLKVCKFIERNRKIKSSNRLFLAISLNDNATKQESRELIHNMTDNFLDKFLNGSNIEILRQIDASAMIESFSVRNHSTLTDYLIIVFNVSNCSSIECIISTNSITSRLIEKDETGGVVEYNARLHKNLLSFKKNLQ